MITFLFYLLLIAGLLLLGDVAGLLNYAGLFYLLLIAGLILPGRGWYMMRADIEKLWKRHEMRVLNSGMEPKRSAAWEKSIRDSGMVLIISGGLAIVLAFGIFALRDGQQRSSQTSISQPR